MGRAGRWTRWTLLAVAVAALAGSGALALARVVAPSSRRGVELVALAPAGLPLALVAVLALAGTLGVARLAATRSTRTAGLVLALVPALALALLHGWWLAPRWTGSPAAADGPRMVVMAQNLEQGDPAALVDELARHRVDVLVLTDVGDEQVAGLVAAGVATTLPYSTLDDPGVGAAGTLVWSRWPITSDVLVSDGGDTRMVGLAVPGVGEVGLVAAHPTPPYQAGGRAWAADWARLVADVRATYGEQVEGPVVVAGDLNATLDHAPVRELERIGFRDAGEQVGAGLAPTWPAGGRQSRLGIAPPPFVALDHVLTAPGLVAVDQVLTGAAGSDHLGVVATLAVPRP